MEPLLPQAGLTPSDVVYLVPARFAAPDSKRIDSHRHAQQTYAAAFLAAERAGLLRLELRPKKALLGLRTVEAVYAEPAGSAGAFPADSLESILYGQAASLAKKGKHEVRNIVAGLLSGASVDPWRAALERVQDALGARKLLTATQKKALGIIKLVSYTTPEQTTALAEEQAGAVQSLLEACQVGRPALWKRLVEEIESAIHSREHEIETPDYNS